MTNQDLLSEEFCFKTNYIIPDVDKHWECLKKYSNETERINNRKDNFKIFVDTNFLLKYYEISLESRRKLFDYINKNKNRIFITKQVEKEFIKNRQSVINKFINNTSKTTFEHFNNIKGSLEAYKNYTKNITNDIKSINDLVVNIEKGVNNLEKLLINEFKTKYDNKVVFNDEYMDLIISCTKIDNLTDKEIYTIINVFKSHENEINNLDLKKKPFLRFPGCGDLGKDRNKEGDFIIYHELLKFLKANNESICFLTYDSTKSDWFNHNQKTVMQYVYHSFSMTENILHIIDAEKFIPDIYIINHKETEKRILWDATKSQMIRNLDIKHDFVVSKDEVVRLSLNSKIDYLFRELDVNYNNVSQYLIFVKKIERFLKVNEVSFNKFYHKIMTNESILNKIQNNELISNYENEIIDLILE